MAESISPSVASLPASPASHGELLTRHEMLLWFAATLVLVLALQARLGSRFDNDSYQYLSTAENIAAGQGVATSIIHFDTERSSGAVPAPLTTFAPGYPIVIAALGKLGFSLETAAALISAMSFIALVPLGVTGAALLELTPLATRLVLFGVLASSVAARFSTAVLSDALFAALATGAIVLLMRHERSLAGHEHQSALLGAAVLVGLTYCVRYAGLLLFIALAVYCIYRFYSRREWSALAAMGVASTPIAIIMLRNASITGTWQGGNEKAAHNALLPAVKQIAISLHDLLLGAGDGSVQRDLRIEAVFFLEIVLLILLALKQRRQNDRVSLQTGTPVLTPFLVLATYLAGIAYLGTSSVISVGPRMFLPLLPTLLLLTAWAYTCVERSFGANSGSRRVFVVTTALLVVSYLSVNLSSLTGQSAPSPHQSVRARFSASSGDSSALAWMAANVPSDQVVAASDGQATAYVIARKTLSLVESEYSDIMWDEPAVLREMRHYDARFLILYPGADARRAPAQQESEFLRRLLDGESVACFPLAHESSEVKIFRDVCP